MEDALKERRWTNQGGSLHLTLAAILALLSPFVGIQAAHAGLDLTWNACNVDGGTQELKADCSSQHVYHLAADFQSDQDLSCIFAAEAVLDFGFASSANSFWDFTSIGACNSGGLLVAVEATSVMAGCSATSVPAPDTALVAVFLIADPPNTAKAYVYLYWGPTNCATLAAGENYYAFHLVISTNNAGEAGGSCEGCAQVASVEWEQLILDPGEQVIKGPGLTGNVVTWTGNAGSTPTQPRSWGLIKSLYR